MGGVFQSFSGCVVRTWCQGRRVRLRVTRFYSTCSGPSSCGLRPCRFGASSFFISLLVSLKCLRPWTKFWTPPLQRFVKVRGLPSVKTFARGPATVAANTPVTVNGVSYELGVVDEDLPAHLHFYFARGADSASAAGPQTCHSPSHNHSLSWTHTSRTATSASTMP